MHECCMSLVAKAPRSADFRSFPPSPQSLDVHRTAWLGSWIPTHRTRRTVMCNNVQQCATGSLRPSPKSGECQDHQADKRCVGPLLISPQLGMHSERDCHKCHMLIYAVLWVPDKVCRELFHRCLFHLFLGEARVRPNLAQHTACGTGTARIPRTRLLHASNVACCDAMLLIGVLVADTSKPLSARFDWAFAISPNHGVQM